MPSHRAVNSVPFTKFWGIIRGNGMMKFPQLWKLAAALALTSFLPAAATGQYQKPQACSAYFAVLHYDQRVPGGYVAGMSDSQTKWFSKNAQKNFPGLCLSLEKARYLVVWSETMTEQNYSETVHRTVQVNTSGQTTESGSFNIYGDVYARGTYSGQGTYSSTSTVTYPETIPVTVTADHCFVYVVRSAGSTIQDDIQKNLTPMPIYSYEARRGRSTSDPTAAGQVGFAIGRAIVKEPTARALERALKHIGGEEAQRIADHSAQKTERATPAKTSTILTVAHETNSPGDSKTPCTISVTSNLDAAEIYVDDSFVGIAPTKVNLGPGQHSIRAFAKGYQNWFRSITVVADSQLQMKVTMEKSQ